jgi:hypothetical protein
MDLPSVITDSFVQRYVFVQALIKVQERMAKVGKPIYDDKRELLLTNLRLLLKSPPVKTKKSRHITDRVHNQAEIYSSVAASGLGGAMDAALHLLPFVPEIDMLLRVLGRFVSVDEFVVAPKGTRKILKEICCKLLVKQEKEELSIKKEGEASC